jgi:hypothetical protein
MSWLLIFFLMRFMRAAGREVRDVNRGQMVARMAGELAEQKSLETPLDGTEQEINSGNSRDGENDFGKRHAACD